MSDPCLIRAGLALCPSGKILNHPWLVVEGGTIRALGEGTPPDVYSSLRQIGTSEQILLPGFVNPHCHLLLTALHDRIPPTTDFWQWIFDLMVEVRGMTPDDLQRSVDEGLKLSLEAGTTTLLDFARQGTERAESPIRILWAEEMIAFDDDVARRQMELIDGTEPIIAAPHAIYSTTPSLLSALVNERERRGGLVTIHLSEIPDENEFALTGHSEGLKRYDAHFGVERKDQLSPGKTPTEYLDSLGMLGPETLLVHGNCLTGSDIDLIAKRKSPLCHCPATHRFFSRPVFPLSDLMDRGIEIVLGTDSLASGPTLSMWEQARLVAQQCPDLKWNQLLRMITSGSAHAIGLPPTHGTLCEGANADLLLVESETPTEFAHNDPRALFDHPIRTRSIIIDGSLI